MSAKRFRPPRSELREGFLQLALSTARLATRFINVDGQSAYATAIAGLKDSHPISLLEGAQAL